MRKTKQRALVVGGVCCLLAAAGLVCGNRLLPAHPVFGAIYTTTASDLNVARASRVGTFLRRHLPRRVVQSPYFPARFKDQPKFLDLDGKDLEWSIGGTDTGWLYFWEPDTARPRAATWEFAICVETNLLNVSTLPTDFSGSTDPRRTERFGEPSTTNAIPVSVGQVLFARRGGETNRVYIVHLKEQNEDRLVVDYCVMER